MLLSAGHLSPYAFSQTICTRPEGCTVGLGEECLQLVDLGDDGPNSRAQSESSRGVSMLWAGRIMLKGDNGSNKKTNELLLWFEDLGIKDVPRVGGKNASLGEMIRHLTKMGIKVPEGFAVTTNSFRAFVAHNQLEEKISDMVKALDPDNPADVAERGKAIRQLFLDSDFPPDVRREVEYGYWELGRKLNMPNPSVAIRSSATSEDLDGASFAGQHETILNVRGEAAVLKATRQGFA